MFLRLPDNVVAQFSPADLDLVLSRNWRPNNGGYLIQNTSVRGKKVRFALHHMILSRTAPCPPKYCADHRNGDRRDNRRENLRWVSRTHNGVNTITRGAASGYKGVALNKHCTDSWVAYYSIPLAWGGKRKRIIGSFKTAEEAARAYDDAVRAFWGDIATVNFPREGERSARARN